ncbi:unnamed protein product [Prorocentrum cordatum]|uniref:Guanylate-binding protein N-terminal domain-containing protein n=1 Tax=Prorocentrum cordatum TaxID=2364126 RepID=A0ABN9UQG4_9DINO|nr:unnamed protein product [Polarella glacialis]
MSSGGGLLEGAGGSAGGFRSKGGMDGVTEGIWVWSEPFVRVVQRGPVAESVAVILMDTQGAWDGSMTKEQFGEQNACTRTRRPYSSLPPSLVPARGMGQVGAPLLLPVVGNGVWPHGCAIIQVDLQRKHAGAGGQDRESRFLR